MPFCDGCRKNRGVGTTFPPCRFRMRFFSINHKVLSLENAGRNGSSPIVRLNKVCCVLFESIFCRVKDGHALSKVKRGGPRLLCKRDKQIRCVVGCRDRVYVQAGDQTADLRHKGRALILIHHGIVTGIADKGQIIAARLQIEELVAGGAAAGRLLQQG